LTLARDRLVVDSSSGGDRAADTAGE